jgi:hypothetical protein
MDRQAVRVVVYAWGRPYVDRLLNYALASLLAPGNLSALVASFDCTVAVVTEEKLFAYVNSHPITERVKSLCPVRLVSLDDIIGEPWQYGISVAYALFRGFCDLGAAMTETYILFLNADFVLAEGCYERLIAHMKRGESVLLSPSYCVVEEEVEPLLARVRSAADGVLVVSPRELARMIIDHRHNTIRAKTISQRGVHFEYMDQAYWQVDDETIIGHQMPICMVAMRPERVLNDINTFWDWGIVYEFCPSRKLTVLGDSDEFLILELRSENTHLDLVQLGPTTAAAAAARMSVYLTRYQLDNSRFPLTLHAGSLPPDIDSPRTQLREFLDEVLEIYQAAPLPDHRNHPQWIYHKLHLARNQEVKHLKRQLRRLDDGYEAERSRMLRIRASARHLLDEGLVLPHLGERPQLDLTFLGEFAAEDIVSERPEGDSQAVAGLASNPEASVAEPAVAQALRELAERHHAAVTAVRARLSQLEKAVLPTMADFFEHVRFVEAKRAVAERRNVRSLGRRAAARLFGAIPDTRRWHPLHFIYRHISFALDQADAAGSGILFVGDKNGLMSRAGTKVRNRCLRISIDGLLRPQIEPAFDEPWCGLSVIELGDDFRHLRALHRAVLPHMLPEGRIVMFWINHACRSGLATRRAFVQAALMEQDGAHVRFITSPSGWGSLGVLKAVRGSPSASRAQRGLMLLADLLKLSLQSVRGRGLRIGHQVDGNCLGMLIEIKTIRPSPEVSPEIPMAEPAAPPSAEGDEAVWNKASPTDLAAE